MKKDYIDDKEIHAIKCEEVIRENSNKEFRLKERDTPSDKEDKRTHQDAWLRV